MQGLGKSLIVIGLLIACIGAFFAFTGRIPWLGRLPGDIVMKRDNFTFHFPIVTCLLLSLVLSLIFWIMRR